MQVKSKTLLVYLKLKVIKIIKIKSQTKSQPHLKRLSLKHLFTNVLLFKLDVNSMNFLCTIKMTNTG